MRSVPLPLSSGDWPGWLCVCVKWGERWGSESPESNIHTDHLSSDSVKAAISPDGGDSLLPATSLPSSLSPFFHLSLSLSYIFFYRCTAKLPECRSLLLLLLLLILLLLLPVSHHQHLQNVSRAFASTQSKVYEQTRTRCEWPRVCAFQRHFRRVPVAEAAAFFDA